MLLPTYSTLPIWILWDRVTRSNDRGRWWGDDSRNSSQWLHRLFRNVSRIEGWEKEGETERGRESERERGGGRIGSMYARVHVHTRVIHAVITRGWGSGCGERWCTITGRPEMIYVGRAGAICIASVFTGRDEAMLGGWVIARARVVELRERLECSDLQK